MVADPISSDDVIAVSVEVLLADIKGPCWPRSGSGSLRDGVVARSLAVRQGPEDSLETSRLTGSDVAFVSIQIWV